MSGTTTTAAASSTKRPAQAQAGPSQPAVKRSKTVKAEDACPSVHEDEDDGEEEPVPEGEMDDAMRARIARKNARVIRNRESAQRSRNQRKQHLAWLEKRVAELESENQQLREGGSPAFVPTSSSQSVRAVSPAHSVSSFATEIGLPIEVVSGSGGVSLASIAPPPSGLAAPPVMEDVKPTITPQPTDASLPALQLENAALRDRVSRLEDLLKHVVALSSFAPTTPAALALPLAPMHAAAPSSVVGMEPAQWGDLLQDTKHSRPVELGQTLSPVPKMNDPVFDVGVDLPVSPPSFSLEDNGDILACHSAAGEDGSVRLFERAESGAIGHGSADRSRVGQDQGLDLASGLQLGVQATLHDQTGAFKINESAAPTADTTSLFDDLWDTGLSALAAQLEGQADLLDTNPIGNEAPSSGVGGWRLDQWDQVWA